MNANHELILKQIQSLQAQICELRSLLPNGPDLTPDLPAAGFAWVDGQGLRQVGPNAPENAKDVEPLYLLEAVAAIDFQALEIAREAIIEARVWLDGPDEAMKSIEEAHDLLRDRVEFRSAQRPKLPRIRQTQGPFASSKVISKPGAVVKVTSISLTPKGKEMLRAKPRRKQSAV